ncbi:MAG: cobalt-precorrin-5B (C(1))-methyltransferase CbiD [Prochlorothrix sp.]|nr:cobalt-precorrin-5B (C(1))-methyltransferase CbiD [Prochlorothrix sp.]
MIMLNSAMAPRSGYTLPVFAAAAALAALQHLQKSPQESPPTQVTLSLLNPPEITTLAIEQVAQLRSGTALAITRSDPGDNLDLTAGTPIWAQVELNPTDLATDPTAITNSTATNPTAITNPTATNPTATDPTPNETTLILVGGEGIGYHQSTGQAAIYRYAQALLHHNLTPLLQPGDRLRVTFILPEGRALAERTSNAAFGVVNGLSLLGTSGISQPLSSPEQLDQFQAELRQRCQDHTDLIFCIGENGLDLARKLGLPPAQTLKTANWIGPLLIEAALLGVQNLLLLGYHGKLIKLAGGIFHTHHHVADGRLDIFAAQGAALGLPASLTAQFLDCGTVEAALQRLRDYSQQQQHDWVTPLYQALAQRLDRQTQHYLQKLCQGQSHSPKSGQMADLTHLNPSPNPHQNPRQNPLPQVGALLFDRQRQILVISPVGQVILQDTWPLNLSSTLAQQR